MADQELDFQADEACALSKEGNSLLMIAQALDVEPDTVLSLIAKRTQLDKGKVKEVFNSMELGLSIKQMPPSIPVEALQIFEPECPQTELTRDFTTELRRCFTEGLLIHQIVDCLGVSETEVSKVLKAGWASVTENQPSTVVAKVPVRKQRAPEESKSLAEREEMSRRREAEERIEPPIKIVEESPQYIYGYKIDSSSLFRTTLSTEETKEEMLGNHTFKDGSVWCEVAGGDIYFTGGRHAIFHSLNEVVRVSGTSLEVTQKAGMLNVRAWHGSVYDKDYLYVTGGSDVNDARECERLSVSEDRWEALQPLPQGCRNVSVVLVKEIECLYALGGQTGFTSLDLIQRLSLRRLEWDLMPLRLPTGAYYIACFSKESKVWFVVGEELYCFNALAESSITHIKQVEDGRSWCGPSYYHRGNLYCSKFEGAAQRFEIGQLCAKRRLGS